MDPPSIAQLAVVSGRRRMGKTFLLEAPARETGGFYFGATEATETELIPRMRHERRIEGAHGVLPPIT